MSDAKAIAAVVRDFLQRKTEPIWTAIGELRQSLAKLQPESIRDEIDRAVADRVPATVELTAPAPDVELMRMAAAEALQPLIERTQASLSERLESAIAGIRVPEDGRSVTPEELEPLISAAVDRALAGRADADERIAAAVGGAVAQALEQLPRPVERDEIRGFVREAVETAAAALARREVYPTPEEFQAIVDGSVARAMAQIPVPKDGHTPSAEELGPIVDEAVKLAVALIRVPEDGHTPTEDELRPLVDAAVARAVAELPQPQNGKDADPKLVREEVERAVAQIEPREPDPDFIRTEISRSVADAVAQLPRPENGKDADPALVRQEVERAVAEIPLPEPKELDPDFVRSEIDKAVAAAIERIPAVEVDAEMLRQAAEQAVSKIPIPEAKGPEPDFVRAEIDRAVAEAVAQIPPARVDPELVRQEAERAVSQIELPAPREPDPDFLRSEIDRSVAEAVAKLPPPKDGADADPDAVRELVETEVAKAVAKIPAPKDGESVHPDTVARMVLEAVQTAIAQLPKARDGEDGRDATQIDYRDGIDEARGYPRGTHALYRGGVIVALRATDPVINGDLTKAGWAVAMNGIAEESEELGDDLRTVTRVTVYTSGKRVERVYQTAQIVDRGVWRPGVYERGDAVSFGGSVFIAQCQTDAKPETNDDWRLAVKRGRDGKDAKGGGS